MSLKTISSAWVKGVYEALSEAQLDPTALFNKAGLNLADLESHEARFDPELMSVIWQLAAIQSNNPAIGVEISKVGKPACFDAIAFVMMSCPNLYTALQNLTRYMSIISYAADVRLIDEPEGVSVTLKLYGKDVPVPRQRIEYVLTTIFNFCQWIAGRKLKPMLVDFASPPPVCLQPYINAFDCPLHFDAPIHRVRFTRDDVMLTLPTANPLLAELHKNYASDHLKQLGNSTTSFKVRALIIRQLSEGEPLRGDIARALCLSERTLQRRLQEENTSFQDLVDSTRRELAEQYLSKLHLTLTQTASLLGFADQSTFFRCSKRWFGMSPKEYRMQLGKNNLFVKPENRGTLEGRTIC